MVRYILAYLWCQETHALTHGQQQWIPLAQDLIAQDAYAALA